jgi:polar amino acid transport system substrate-binding protein
MSPPSSFRRAAVAALATTLLTAVAACGGGADAATGGDGSGGTTVQVGALSNGAATETPITVTPVEEIRATLPQAIRDSGTLTIGSGTLPAGSPPLGYTGTDQQTLVGSEPDLARLVAGVLGLKPQFEVSTWENMFVGIDSGRVDVGFSNITDTEERKKKYDFAGYRQDNLGFETLASNPWTFTGDYRQLAGLRTSVSKGTNQEKILLEWQAKLQSEGKDVAIAYYPDINAVQLALDSNQIDAYLGPNPGLVYQVKQAEGTPSPKKVAGTYSGAGGSLQGLIAATVRKDSGLAQPLAAAINHLIENGQYAAWLQAWGLSAEAVPRSEVNPPGLPITNS